MKSIGTAEGAAIEAAIQETMLDTCVVLVFTETEGELHEPVTGYVPGVPSICRFRGKKSEWRPNPEFALSEADALLQVPKDLVVRSVDRITITHRFGVQLASPLTYDVVGDPVPTIYSQHVMLQERHL